MSTVNLAEYLDKSHPGHVALACASLGWRVHPLRRDTKLPAATGWPQLATIDPQLIKWWWDANGPWSGRLCGIATGRESGIWVLDVDPDGYGPLRRLQDEHGPLPDTFTVRTPRGGLHLYFAYPADCEIVTRAGALGTGLDTRGYGGNVVAPETTIGGGRYRITVDDVVLASAPTWLEDRCERRPDHPLTADEFGYGERIDVDEWVDSAGDVADGAQENYVFRGLCSLRRRGASRAAMVRNGLAVVSAFRQTKAESWTETWVVKKVDYIRGKWPAGSVQPSQTTELFPGARDLTSTNKWWAK